MLIDGPPRDQPVRIPSQWSGGSGSCPPGHYQPVLLLGNRQLGWYAPLTVGVASAY